MAAAEALKETDEDFALALDFVLEHEGGNDPDLDGGTSRGIIQKTYNAWRDRIKKPRQLVRYASDDEVREIYKTLYWDESEAHKLDFPWNVIHFDSCVQHGEGISRSLKDASRSPCEYLMRRMKFYADLAQRKPEMRQFIRGWLNRVTDLFDLVVA